MPGCMALIIVKIKSVDRVASLLSTKIICVLLSVLRLPIADRLEPKRKQTTIANSTFGGIDTNGKFNPKNQDEACRNSDEPSSCLSLAYGLDITDLWKNPYGFVAVLKIMSYLCRDLWYERK